MSDEYWATFSIFDHRRSLYRNALVLFDRVVIPVPTAPIRDLEQEEIDVLSAEADYLESQEAAVKFEWNLDEFYGWRENTIGQDSVHSEALAKVLVNDPPYATRLQLSQQFNDLTHDLLPKGVDSVIAVPVYGTRAKYESATKELYTAEYATLEIILKHFPVPANDAPLEDIVRLRAQPQLQDSLYHLRKWQTQTVRELLQQNNNEKLVRAAARDFERCIKQYDEAMVEAKLKKVQTAVISVLAVGAALAVSANPFLVTLAALAPPLFSVRELIKPCWKEISDKDCAPAGVIYTAAKL